MPPRTTRSLPLGGPFLPIVFFAAFAFYYLFLPPLFADADTPWHIATGQLILETGTVPHADTWSFTAPGAFWLNYSWGWDALIALLHKAVGPEGLFTAAALWLAGLVTLLGVVLLKRGGVSQDPVMITLAVVAMVLLPSMGFRPQSFSFLAALLVHAMLHWNRTSEKPQHIIWMLPLFMVLWVNMHSGFVFGFILLGAYGLEAMMDKDHARFRRLVITGLLCVVAIHVTPVFAQLGWNYLPTYYASTATEANQYIAEWAPYRFQLYAGFDVLVLVLFLSANFADRNVPVADRIITAAWTVAALSSVRNFALLAVVAAPLFAIRLEGVLLHKSDSPLLKAPHGRIAWAGAILACALLAISPARKLATGKDTVIDTETVPVEALAFLKEHYASLRLFNSWSFGGYMIYYNRDSHKVFIDGRGPTVYTLPLVEDTMALQEGFSSAIAEKYALQGYLLKNEESPATITALRAAPGWKLVYRDDVASVVVRTELAGITDIRPLTPKIPME